MHPIRQNNYTFVVARPAYVRDAVHYTLHVLKRVANWHPHPFRW